MDLMKRFPIRSSRNNQYMLIMYAYDPNTILMECLKSRTHDEILRAYLKFQQRLQDSGFAPTLMIMNNEASMALRRTIKNKQCYYQLMPPNAHQRNAAERTVHTWKNHFCGGLATIDPDFPIIEWCRLVKQGKITINLMWSLRVNPKLSAWQHINGTFNFDATPVAPPGCKVIIHEKSNQCSSWDLHGLIGLYVGPALEYYRCFYIYCLDTKQE